MKKIMILGASSLQLPGIIKAKEMGLYVIAVDMDRNAVGFNYADESLIISTTDIPNVVKSAREIEIDGILTLATDMPVRTVAAVAEELGLSAIGIENSMKATDKALMREAFKEKGVPCPCFFTANNENEFIQAVNEITKRGYKCIVKPVDNSGSRGVNLLSKFDKESLEQAYKYSKDSSKSGKVIVEEYMEGPEVCVETLSVDGVCYPIQITDKLTTGAPYFVEMGHSQPSQLSIEDQEDIKRVAIAANMAIGNYNGSSCTEVKMTKEGAKVVEVGARLAGDYMTSDLVPLSTGISMIESIIKIALGERPDYAVKYNKGSAIRFLEVGEGIIDSISGVEEAQNISGVKRVGIDRKIGDRVVPIKSSLDRVGYVIAQADTPDEAINICEQAISKIQICVINK